MFYFHKVTYVQYLGKVEIFHTQVKKFLPLYIIAKMMTTNVLPPFHGSQCILLYTMNHKKGGSTLFIITLENLNRFLANVNSSSRSLYVIDGPSVVCRLSVVCLPSVVCLSSVTLVHPTQAIEIFGNISTPCGTLAIRVLCVKILPRSSQGNPSVGGVKHKRGSRI